jgi:hypothetical protein
MTSYPVAIPEEKQEPKENKKRAPKKVKEEKLAFRIPPRSRQSTSTKWARHIYEVIKHFAPQLLLQEPVMKAYNELVDCLESHGTTLRTHPPLGRDKYLRGIIMEGRSSLPIQHSFIHNLPSTNEERIQKESILTHVKETYMVLYHLIKADIIPLTQGILKERYVKSMTEFYQIAIANCVQKTIQLEQRHLQKMKVWETTIHRYTTTLSEVEKEADKRFPS